MELDGNSKAVNELDVIGVTSLDADIRLADGTRISLAELQNAYENKLENVFHCNVETSKEIIETFNYENKTRLAPAVKAASPRVLIPV